MTQSEREAKLERCRQIVRAGVVQARLLGERELAQRELVVAKGFLAAYIVADAKRRGIEDARIDPSWGLMSQKARDCAHRQERCACMPYDGSGHGTFRGWPMVWKVTEDWGVGCGCGNRFNHNLDLALPFTELMRGYL